MMLHQAATSLALGWNWVAAEVEGVVGKPDRNFMAFCIIIFKFFILSPPKKILCLFQMLLEMKAFFWNW
jgi:hypothetical protein